MVTASGQPAGEAPLKIGVLTDMSSLFADIGGQGSVTALRMAVEDFGGKVLEADRGGFRRSPEQDRRGGEQGPRMV